MHLVVPEALQRQVDHQLQFSDLQRDPARYQGRTVVLGGRIAALRLSDHVTELGVTELPLTGIRDRPTLFAQSGSQFLVAHRGPLDPAIYRSGRPITVVGVVQEGQASSGQDVPEPVLEPKYLHLWPDRPISRRLAPVPFFLFSADPFYRFDPFHRHFSD